MAYTVVDSVGLGVLAAKGNTAVPLFPATCPFITAVGATQIQPGASVTDPEEVWNQGGISGGGGFSNIFSMPAYQADAVNSFMNNHPPHLAAKINMLKVGRFYLCASDKYLTRSMRSLVPIRI